MLARPGRCRGLRLRLGQWLRLRHWQRHGHRLFGYWFWLGPVGAGWSGGFHVG
jgi:hypothetical protein